MAKKQTQKNNSNTKEKEAADLFILTDSAIDLPSDVDDLLSNLAVQSTNIQHETVEAVSPLGVRAITQQAAPEMASLIPNLNRWEIQVHKYENKTEAKAGFLGFGGVEAKLLEAGLVHESKRFIVKKTKQGRLVEFGVAVRLWVAVSTFDFKVDLTIPNLAASTQITKNNARIGLSVVGFRGALGELLPSPESLSVENFSTYTQAFHSIQTQVFGPDGEQKLSPVLLGYYRTNSNP